MERATGIEPVLPAKSPMALKADYVHFSHVASAQLKDVIAIRRRANYVQLWARYFAVVNR